MSWRPRRPPAREVLCARLSLPGSSVLGSVVLLGTYSGPGYRAELPQTRACEGLGARPWCPPARQGPQFCCPPPPGMGVFGSFLRLRSSDTPPGWGALRRLDQPVHLGDFPPILFRCLFSSVGTGGLCGMYRPSASCLGNLDDEAALRPRWNALLVPEAPSASQPQRASRVCVSGGPPVQGVAL